MSEAKRMTALKELTVAKDRLVGYGGVMEAINEGIRILQEAAPVPDSALPETLDIIANGICVALYDRFVMGRWEAKDAVDEVKVMLTESGLAGSAEGERGITAAMVADVIGSKGSLTLRMAVSLGDCEAIADSLNSQLGERGLTELLQPLKDACDREWKDETPQQIVAIAANAIYWRGNHAPPVINEWDMDIPLDNRFHDAFAKAAPGERGQEVANCSAMQGELHTPECEARRRGATAPAPTTNEGRAIDWRENYMELAAACYQMAGVVSAPLRIMDALSAAAHEGVMLPEDFLPVSQNEFKPWPEVSVVAPAPTPSMWRRILNPNDPIESPDQEYKPKPSVQPSTQCWHKEINDDGICKACGAKAAIKLPFSPEDVKTGRVYSNQQESGDVLRRISHQDQASEAKLAVQPSTGARELATGGEAAEQEQNKADTASKGADLVPPPLSNEPVANDKDRYWLLAECQVLENRIKAADESLAQVRSATIEECAKVAERFGMVTRKDVKEPELIASAIRSLAAEERK